MIYRMTRRDFALLSPEYKTECDECAGDGQVGMALDGQPLVCAACDGSGWGPEIVVTNPLTGGDLYVTVQLVGQRDQLAERRADDARWADRRATIDALHRWAEQAVWEQLVDRLSEQEGA